MGSVPDILQEPLGWNFPAELSLLRRLIDLSGHRVKLRALQITALRIGDLVGGGAAHRPPLHKIGQRYALVGKRVAMLPAAAPAVAVLALDRTGLVADMLGVGGEFRMAYGRRRVAEAQIHIDLLQAGVIGPAGAADHQNMRAGLEETAIGNLDR